MSTDRDRRDCPQLTNAAPYALGAIEDAKAYSEHLETCEICAAATNGLREATDVLPRTPAPRKAPAELIENVMRSVRAEADLLNAAGAEADRVTPAKPGLVARFKASLRGRRTAAIGVGAALVACLAVLTVMVANGPETDRVIRGEVAASIRDAGTSASLVEDDGSTRLEVAGLPAAGADRIYEVWIQRPDESVTSTKSPLEVSDDGSGSVFVTDSLKGVKAVLVTSEPAGGSPQPTRDPVLTVNVAS